MNRRNNLIILFLALALVSFVVPANAFGSALYGSNSFRRVIYASNVSVIFCNSDDGCVTDDGWQVSCPAQQPVMKQMVKVLKVFAVSDYYIVAQTMTLPQAALGFAISPDDSPVQSLSPNAMAPEDIDDIPRSKVRGNRFLASLPRCTRIPPGVFRDGRWFPFGVPFGMCCKHCSFFKNR
ncbi:hypothetical protein BWQ96_05946 [Gracilariopsis chorda]|uniref:Uncharacterized protein n=1 Tax=Gracilariopsis chorda TaxID=448386 RepID=A0A2V3IQG7_9FLOR|nr:hypothetical protein BWQ96_05946 [Gracilariopsis chorda]|eukprot:PXF44319.1 hypothetical protein BWQ96_05946 [Gracilariopsis chorda]